MQAVVEWRWRLSRGMAIVAVVLWAGLSSAVAEKRVALVIGNSDYLDVPVLENPRNDAEDVAAALKRLGFETTVSLDADRSAMEKALEDFRRQGRRRRRGAVLLRRPRHAASGRELPDADRRQPAPARPACAA